MHPLVPYLGGRPHPQGQRLVNLQRCLRTVDLDQVGDHTHLTVFGMLGSWSLGDYDGSQSLRWSLQLLRDGFGLDPESILVTVWEGDEHCPTDESSLQTWQDLGVSRIIPRGREHNWWGPNGPDGLCDPDTEIFVWVGEGTPSSDPDHPGWMELWNHVLMSYRQTEHGHLQPLEQRNVDTGMGLERLSRVLQGTSSVYQTDIFSPWMEVVDGWGVPVGPDQRLLSDHLRSLMVLLSDGVLPSNTGRGYVPRRLLRRSLGVLSRHGVDELPDLPRDVCRHDSELFGMTVDHDRNMRLLRDEEQRYQRMLVRGRRPLQRLRQRGRLTREDRRFLRETHGLPDDVIDRLLQELDVGDQ